jgi:restriction endonuclease S subunit
VLNEYYQKGKTFGYQNGMGGLKNLDMGRYMEIPIPIPSISVQRKVIEECELLENEFNTTRMSIESYRQKIEELFEKLDIANSRGYRLSLADSEKFSVSIGKRILNKQLEADGKIPVYSANVIEPFGYINDLLISDFSVPSVLWGIDGDWMTCYIAENKEFYPTDHCGVLRCKTNEVNTRYLAHILEKEGKKMGFSRSYRASIDRIKGITFTVPDKTLQDETIIKIEEIEAHIHKAEKQLEVLSGKTVEILNRYLN